MNETITTSAALVPRPTAHGTSEALLSERGVRCLMFPNQPGAAAAWLARHLPGAEVRRSDPRSAGLAAELDAYLRGELTAFTAALDLAGTPFQLSVWRQLQAIPYGEVRSYADGARAHGPPAAVAPAASAPRPPPAAG